MSQQFSSDDEEVESESANCSDANTNQPLILELESIYDDEQLASFQASKNPNSVHAAVHRSNISSTTVQEGSQALEELDVEVYDQQTYEKGVFEQVDEAISAADKASSSGSAERAAPSNNLNDLMNLIHPQTEHNADEQRSHEDRDEQVIQLARQQRSLAANRGDQICDSNQRSSIPNLPRIPRLSRPVTIKKETCSQEINESRDSRSGKPSIKVESRSRRRKTYLTDHNETSSNSAHSSEDEYKPSDDDDIDDAAHQERGTESDEDDEDIEYSTDRDDDEVEQKSNEKNTRKKRKKLEDDGDFEAYQARMKALRKMRAQMKLDNILDDGTEFKKLDELVEVDGDLQIPKEIWDNLFEHQKTGIRWLWELHQLGTGGILGDEMGLGKTIQMIAFLVALKNSSISSSRMMYKSLGPVVLVCPATVMHQWLLELRKWWPQFRVAILHSTGTFSGDRRKLIEMINKSNGILIVSFPGVVIYQDILHKFDWHYAILDEGHKIRNPDAQVTLACKRFRTPHRIILSGSPVQNNLKELWSIFDFIYPGKLGTLPVFMEQFATPITQGGYANASDMQVQIAYKCTCVLRDTIKPFLLRRTKAEVNNKLKLPERSEQVLFCKLTEKQRKLYQAYLESPTVRDIKNGFCQIFVGLIQLRKICNHPDLFDASECKKQVRSTQKSMNQQHVEFFSEDETYGLYKKSGKMMVVEALLKLWKEQGHKVLLFTQSRQMLKIFKNYLDERDYKHLIMDGMTPIGVRQTMIEEFNKSPEIFIFLLTTRVGGVGINLTGANRILIYDPDWNPSTDIQARERAWRIGQQRHVIIYRLLTAGTIEEKIYHRQVFKLYLTNRVLKDAKQKRFFKTNDLHELFTLGDNEKNIETKALFDDDLQIDLKSIKKSREERKAIKRNRKEEKKRRKELKLVNNGDTLNSSHILSEEKLNEMRERAKRLSQMIANQYGSSKGSEGQVKTEVRVKAEPVVVNNSQASSSADNLGDKLCLQESDQNTPQAKSRDVVAPRPSSSKKQRVEYLVKQTIYKPDEEPEKPDTRYKQDDYILERLFKRSDISGALKHDKIETDTTADYKVVESEAEKVARDAIRALKESRRLCLDSTMGVPNWTGRNGHIASGNRLTPKNRGRIPLTNKSSTASSMDSQPKASSSKSESLLDSIRKRNRSNPIPLGLDALSARPPDSDDEERDKDFVGKATEVGAEVMADKLREFIIFKSIKSGEAQTDELLDFFKANFKPDKSAVFKALLYKMCEFHRRADKGFWMIKSDFRNI